MTNPPIIPNEIIWSWDTMVDLLGALELHYYGIADALGPADESQGFTGWSRAMEIRDGNGVPITFPLQLVSERRMHRAT